METLVLRRRRDLLMKTFLVLSVDGCDNNSAEISACHGPHKGTRVVLATSPEQAARTLTGTTRPLMTTLLGVVPGVFHVLADEHVDDCSLVVIDLGAMEDLLIAPVAPNRDKGFLAMATPPTWKNTFNTELRDLRWGHIGNAIKVAAENGYQFLSWNGRVYDVSGADTGLLETDLDRSVQR